MSEFCRRRNECRICGARDWTEILDLGAMPPANAFLAPDEIFQNEPMFPLKVYFCGQCGLLQLRDVVDPNILFGRYDYFTSASAPLVEHFSELGKQLVKKFIKSKNDLVVEIGGNDAVLLRAMQDACRVLNVEPAKNIAAVSFQRGVETKNDFFSSALARRTIGTHGKARLIIANNVIAHIDDILDVFRGVHGLLDDEGVFVSEVHWVGNLIGGGGFDQIYHEHLCYFSLNALHYLAAETGFSIFDVEAIPIHGQSLRVYMSRSRTALPSVAACLNKERKLGLHTPEPYHRFAERVLANRDALRFLLERLKREGRSVAGYGAPAKGNTLLNYCGIDHALMDFIIDTTPAKQGMRAPGSHIPIYAPDALEKKHPDYVVLLAWNYADAILAKEKNLRKRGTRFIIPVPDVRIV